MVEHQQLKGRVTNLLAGEIALVADEHLVHLFVGVAVNLIHPLLHIVEALLVRHVVHNNDAMCATVILRAVNLSKQLKMITHH